MYRMIFDYTKEILERVSFDPELFAKELKRARHKLLPFELERLNNWLQWYTMEKPELRKRLDSENNC